MIFRKTVPSGLTPKQKEVFLKMDREKYFLYCNEGANYKCWLQKENSEERIYINRRTGESLSNREIIIPDDSFNSKNRSIFRFKLK